MTVLGWVAKDLTKNAIKITGKIPPSKKKKRKIMVTQVQGNAKTARQKPSFLWFHCVTNCWNKSNLMHLLRYKKTLAIKLAVANIVAEITSRKHLSCVDGTGIRARACNWSFTPVALSAHHIHLMFILKSLLHIKTALSSVVCFLCVCSFTLTKWKEIKGTK